MEHTEKRGKSGQDTEKERDSGLLDHWPYEMEKMQ